MVERREQRPFQQVVVAEQVGLAGRLAPGLGQPDREQLAGIVPLVQRLGRREPLVALQPDQRRVQHRRQRLRGLGLADAGLALQQDRLPHPRREEQGRAQRLVGQVAGVVEGREQGGNIGELFGEIAHVARNQEAVVMDPLSTTPRVDFAAHHRVDLPYARTVNPHNKMILHAAIALSPRRGPGEPGGPGWPARPGPG